MAKGINNKDFKKWEQRITLAKKVREHADESKWREYINLFNNKDWNLGNIGRNEGPVAINKLRSTVSFLRDSIYFREPRVQVTPEPDDDQIEQLGAESQVLRLEDQAKLLEHIINNLIRRLKVKKIGRKVLLDAALTPIGWIKVSHNSKTISEYPELDTVTAEDHLVQRVNPFNMVVDPEAETLDMSRVRWLAEKKVMTLDAAKEAYKDATGLDVTLSKLTADSIAFEEDENRIRNMGEAEREFFERVVIWEIHDREGDELIELSTANGILRRVSPHPYEATRRDDLGFIYAPITLSDEDPMGFYPRAYVESLIPINNAINQLTSYFKVHVGRAAKRNPLVKKGAFDDVDQLTSAADMQVLEINPDFDNPVELPPIATIPEDAWNLNNYLYGPVWQELSRIDEMSRGTTVPGTSPTEASLISQGTQVGVESKADMVQDWLSDVCKLLLVNAQQFTTKDKAIQIAGPSGSQWVKWGAKDIKGSYNLKVEAFSTMPFNDMAEARKIVDALNLLYGKPEVDNVELLKAVAERLKLPDRFIRQVATQGPQDPLHEHTQLVAGAPLRVDPSEDHTYHLQQHEQLRQYLVNQQGQNPGNPQLFQMLQQLTGHMDQHRLALVQLNQPTQAANAQQPQQNIAQDRSALGGQPGQTATNQGQFLQQQLAGQGGG